MIDHEEITRILHFLEENSSYYFGGKNDSAISTWSWDEKSSQQAIIPYQMYRIEIGNKVHVIEPKWFDKILMFDNYNMSTNQFHEFVLKGVLDLKRELEIDSHSNWAGNFQFSAYRSYTHPDYELRISIYYADFNKLIVNQNFSNKLKELTNASEN